MDIFDFGPGGSSLSVDNDYLCTTLSPSGEMLVYKTGKTGRSVYVDTKGNLLIKIDPNSIAKFYHETVTAQIDGAQCQFALSHTPINNNVKVYYNGLLLDRHNEEYEIENNKIILKFIPTKHSTISVDYFYK